MSDRVSVRFEGSYFMQGGPCFTRGETASVDPVIAQDIVQRGLGRLVDTDHPQRTNLSPEEDGMKAFASPPAHKMVTSPDAITKGPSPKPQSHRGGRR